MPKATIGGAQIYYEVTGKGAPLVLTLGQGSTPQARAELVDGLARNHAVLAYDQRGTGRNEPSAQAESMEELARDIVGLMDAAGFPTAHVVGHSTGAGKATALAAHHPERVTRLVLGAPWTHAGPDLRVLQAMRMAAARTLPADHYARYNALLLYPPEYRREHFKRFDKMAQDALASPQDPLTISARLNAILAFDARPLYPRIRCPTLVLAARDDLVMPLWFAQDAASAIAAARLVALDGGGHMFPETRADEFLAEVLAFLR